MELLCIDPGNKVSGSVIYNTMIKQITDIHTEIENEELISLIPNYRGFTDYLIIETVRSYGMAVGDSVFETMEFLGRCRQAYGMTRSVKMSRLEVKERLCHSHKAGDANIRQALLDLFPASGGGSRPQIGTKRLPGPLYGMSKHAWSALALGVAYSMGAP